MKLRRCRDSFTEGWSWASPKIRKNSRMNLHEFYTRSLCSLVISKLDPITKQPEEGKKEHSSKPMSNKSAASVKGLRSWVSPCMSCMSPFPSISHVTHQPLPWMPVFQDSSWEISATLGRSSVSTASRPLDFESHHMPAKRGQYSRL